MPRIFGPIVKPGVPFSTTKLPNRGAAVLGRVGAGQQRDAERHVGAGVGDERLATVDQPAAVLLHGSGRDAAGVGAGVGLGQPERTEHPTLGERSQPTLALVVVAEQEQRHRPDRHVRLERGGDRLVGVAELLERGDEADGRHPDPAPLLGHEHPEQPELAHLPQQVGRALRPLPRRRRPDGDLLGRELLAELGQVALGFGEREVHAPNSIRPIGTRRTRRSGDLGRMGTQHRDLQSDRVDVMMSAGDTDTSAVQAGRRAWCFMNSAAQALRSTGT